MNEKTKKIVIAIKMTGLEVLDEDFNGFIVSRTDDDIIFSEPQFHEGWPTEDIEVNHSRFDFEQVACKWFTEHADIKDVGISFAIAQMWALSDYRGILRHVIDWTNGSNIKCRWNIVEVGDDDVI